MIQCKNAIDLFFLDGARQRLWNAYSNRLIGIAPVREGCPGKDSGKQNTSSVTSSPWRFDEGDRLLLVW